MSEVSSHHMQYCAQNEEYQLGATGAKKVAVYMAYAFGVSFFIGLIRLIAALGALCVDYKAKAMAQEYQMRANANDVSAQGGRSLTHEHPQNPLSSHVQQVASEVNSATRVQDVGSGIDMCKKDISSHWEQVTRAILELTVVGAWIYAVIEAVQQYRSEAEGSVDALDWGRYKGMLGRITSNFADRQYVPEEVKLLLLQDESWNAEEERPSGAQGRPEQFQRDRVTLYQKLTTLYTVILILEKNPTDWNLPEVRTHLVTRLRANPKIPSLDAEWIRKALADHKFEQDQNGWYDASIPA